MMDKFVKNVIYLVKHVKDLLLNVLLVMIITYMIAIIIHVHCNVTVNVVVVVEVHHNVPLVQIIIK